MGRSNRVERQNAGAENNKGERLDRDVKLEKSSGITAVFQPMRFACVNEDAVGDSDDKFTQPIDAGARFPIEAMRQTAIASVSGCNPTRVGPEMEIDKQESDSASYDHPGRDLNVYFTLL